MKQLTNCGALLKLLLFSSIILTIISCGNDLYGDVVVDSILLEKLHVNAEDTLYIDNQKFILKTELNRNLMPGIALLGSSENRGLTALLFIVNTDSTLITKRFEIKALYVINKEQIWTSLPKPRVDSNLPISKLSVLSIDGPYWETGIYIDVEVEIEDLNTSKIHYLIAKKQYIQRLD